MMATWIRFEQAGRTQFGTLIGDQIEVYQGHLFDRSSTPQPTGERLALASVKLLTPCVPGKFLGLWNNFHQRAAIEGLSRPEHPLYFVKTTNSYLASGETIRQPRRYDGPVVFEGELGIVIGKECCDIGEDEVDPYIFGYTCVNDVTARGVLKADPSFPQWVRAKSFDTFGVFGPGIVTDLEPDRLTVHALIDGVEKQNYPVADMFMRPRQIVSRLSQDMTLQPGDLIACGTSFGTEAMPSGCRIDIVIDGVGVLSNRFE
jgi:2-keto-4-pentenoate hydratase/2-oxohepta-3-ene-1,7-dioic acid hydratase in catechol pathway